MKFLLPFFFIIPILSACGKEKYKLISPDHDLIYYNGRFDISNPKQPEFFYPGVEICASFTGTSCQIKLGQDHLGNTDQSGTPHSNFYNVFLDAKLRVLEVKDGLHEFEIGKGLKDTVHSLKIIKRTESLCGKGYFAGVLIDQGAKMLPYTEVPSLKIEFIGNSITCGYGNEGDNKDCPFSAGTENNYLTYGSITAREIHAEYRAVAYSGRGVYQNYDQSTAGTLPEIYDLVNPFEPESLYDFSAWIPDIIVVNLGTNDFAHELPDSAGFVNAYSQFLGQIKSRYPQSKIICLIGPMMSDHWPPGIMAKTHALSYIRKAIDLQASEGIYFLELSPQGRFGFGCNYHPNVRQHEMNAGELVRFIREKGLVP